MGIDDAGDGVCPARSPRSRCDKPGALPGVPNVSKAMTLLSPSTKIVRTVPSETVWSRPESDSTVISPGAEIGLGAVEGEKTAVSAITAAPAGETGCPRCPSLR